MNYTDLCNLHMHMTTKLIGKTNISLKKSIQNYELYSFKLIFFFVNMHYIPQGKYRPIYQQLHELRIQKIQVC